MAYTKIKIENAEALLKIGAFLAHSPLAAQNDELEKLTDEDMVIKIVNRIDRGVIISMPLVGNTPRYEISNFTNGYWWLKE